MFKWPVIIGMSACLGLSSLLSAASAETTRREFLWHGKTLDEQAKYLGSSKLRSYRAAVRKYGKEPCYKPDELDRPAIDWTRVKTTHEIDVCLFQIADVLRDTSLLQQSLTASGFGQPSVFEKHPNVARHSGIKGKGYVVQAGVGPSNHPRWFGFVTAMFSYGLMVSITLDSEGLPYSTNTVFTFK